MNKTSKMLLWALLVFAVPSVISSCKKDEDEDEVTILSPVAGEFVGEDTCNAGSQYVMLVYNQANDLNKVYIENVADLGEQFEGTVSGNTFTLIERNLEASSASGLDTTYLTKITGSGSVSGSILKFNVQATPVTGGADNEFGFTGNCQFTGSRDYIGPAF